MKAQISAGRILEHGRPIGSETEADVMRRAREIAETNGRRPENYTQTDVDQARQELIGVVSEAADHDDEPLGQAPDWTEVENRRPNEAPRKYAADEQTVAERLVDEGVSEATHDQMLEGNRSSRAADQS